MKVTHSGQLTVDLGLESTKNSSLLCSDCIDLYVDLSIENEGQVESSTATVSQAQDSETQVDESEKMKKCTGVQKNLSRSSPLVELRNAERCDSRTGKDGREIGTLSESKTNWFQSTWPDWVDPLPPVEIYMESSPMENIHVLRKAVTFSDEVTFVEPVEPVTSVQEEREADSFSYSDCSDDDTDVGASKVNDSIGRPGTDVSSSKLSEECILNPADMSAAYQLLSMSNVPRFKDLDSGEDVNTGIALSKTRNFPEVYDPTDDLDKLSGLVDKIYAAVPPLHTAAASYGRYLRESEGGAWTVMDISKYSGVFKLKRLKRDRELWSRKPKFVYLDSDSSDDNEVLDRPPWKRMYKSLRTLV